MYSKSAPIQHPGVPANGTVPCTSTDQAYQQPSQQLTQGIHAQQQQQQQQEPRQQPEIKADPDAPSDAVAGGADPARTPGCNSSEESDGADEAAAADGSTRTTQADQAETADDMPEDMELLQEDVPARVGLIQELYQC